MSKLVWWKRLSYLQWNLLSFSHDLRRNLEVWISRTRMPNGKIKRQIQEKRWKYIKWKKLSSLRTIIHMSNYETYQYEYNNGILRSYWLNFYVYYESFGDTCGYEKDAKTTQWNCIGKMEKWTCEKKRKFSDISLGYKTKNIYYAKRKSRKRSKTTKDIKTKINSN